MTTWMVVEDEPDLYEMLLAMYEMIGVDGMAFTDGEQATAWVNDIERGYYTPQDVPELALLDIRLPGQISGPAVGARLRNCEATQRMVVVLMTAYKLSVEEEQQAFEQSGADMIFYKPLPPLGEFQAMLQDLIAARQI